MVDTSRRHREWWGRIAISTWLVASAVEFGLPVTRWALRGTEAGLRWVVIAFVGIGTVLPLCAAILALRGVLWPAAVLACVSAGSLLIGLVVGEPISAATLISFSVSLVVGVWMAVRCYLSRIVALEVGILLVLSTAVAGRIGHGVGQLVDLYSVESGVITTAVGRDVQQMEFVSGEGNAIRIEDLAQIVLIDFIAENCEPCWDEMPAVVRIQREESELPRADVVLVISGVVRSRLDAVARRSGMPRSRIGIDRDRWSERLGIRVFPTKVLVRAGRIELVEEGARDEPYSHWKGVLARYGEAEPPRESQRRD